MEEQWFLINFGYLPKRESMSEMRNRVCPYEKEWDWRNSHPVGTFVWVKERVYISGTNASYIQLRKIRLA